MNQWLNVVFGVNLATIEKDWREIEFKKKKKPLLLCLTNSSLSTHYTRHRAFMHTFIQHFENEFIEWRKNWWMKMRLSDSNSGNFIISWHIRDLSLQNLCCYCVGGGGICELAALYSQYRIFYLWYWQIRWTKNKW